jgi:tryptophan-rich sensory protein
MRNLRHLANLALWVIGVEFAGIIGSIFTMSAIPVWYATLTKPTWNPPAWVFGPVWTLLFAMMGLAAYLVWQKGIRKTQVRQAIVVFVAQLILNISWSYVFFTLHSPGGAFVEIIGLWFMILATIVAFARVSKPAAWLLLPYILWVSFAAVLNYSIWQLALT